MRHSCSGFTLIELVSVLIITGIMAAYVALRWPANNEVLLPAQAAQLAGHLRHTQSLAMQWGAPLRFNVFTSGYYVTCQSASAVPPCDSSPVIDPATNQAFSIVLQSGLTLSGNATTDFDSLGRPQSGGALITAPRTFTLAAGAATQLVSLSPVSGFAATTP